MVEALLLGVAQDAGAPQAGCHCPHCNGIRSGDYPEQYAVSLALIDRYKEACWLIDATPDFKRQLELLETHAPTCALKGIFLTHAHIGHYTGLMHLGLEAMNTHQLPVYGSKRMLEFLSQNAPWSQLVARHNISLHPLTADVGFALSSDLHLTALAVPHRNEFSDTLAFLISGGRRRLLYCPDIDRWDGWHVKIAKFLVTVDIALLDGCFFSADELPERAITEVPHPLITDTVKRLAGSPCDLHFIHLNHSNPLFTAAEKRAWLREQGMNVAETGQCWQL